MQIKPHFEEYEELSRKPIIKDGRGTQYSLVHFRGTVLDKQSCNSFHYENSQYTNPETEEKNKNTFRLPKGYVVEKKYEGYIVMSDKLDKFSNGATGYEETLFWSSPKKLEIIAIPEIDITLIEVFTGCNSYFNGELPTMNTKFIVCINKKVEKE